MPKNTLPRLKEQVKVEQVTQLLKKGMVGVISTDTIYGIVGLALNPKTVEEIYHLRKRAKDKPFIILISGISDLEKFGVKLTDKQKKFLEKYWPNSLSVVLPVAGKEFAYLHRGKNSLAFRMPKDEKLLELLKHSGPLVAPSANFAGEKPSESIEEAKKYFADKVAFYVDGGRVKSSPSTLIQLNDDGSWKILRQGSFRLAG